MRIKQNLLTYNALIYLRTECSERKKRSGPNKKKNPQDQILLIICAPNLIRIAIDAGMISPWFNLRTEQVLLFITRKYIDATKLYASLSDADRTRGCTTWTGASNDWILPKDVNANRFFCLIGLKPGQTTYIPLWDRMEGERLWTQGKFKIF